MNNEVLKAMCERRSVRSYKSDPVPQELIKQVVRAGTYAATGMNRQSPIILAVTNKEMRDKLSKMNADIMCSDKDPFYGAPVVLVVLADKSVPQTATRYTRMLALDEQTRQAVDSLTLEQAEPLLLLSETEQRLEAARIIMQRELTPMQARRLVLQRVSIQEKATGKRRAVRSVMENMQRICDELNAQGVSASVGIHAQNQGICMQIFIKNG